MMNINEQITQEKQQIAKYEKSLALEKLKKRRADTRRKIELGGLVIKSGFDGYSKATILGAIAYAKRLAIDDESYLSLFENIGNNLFLNHL